MKLVGILGAQAALILGLDLYFETRLGLWLLYFLPLLGSARVPSVRVTLVFALVPSLLILVVGLCKIGQDPWEEIFVPRVLAVYALGLTAVLLIRGKQFAIRAGDAFAEAAAQTRKHAEESRQRGDVDLALERLRILFRQLDDARRTQDQELAGTFRNEIEHVLGVISVRLQGPREAKGEATEG